MTEYYFVAVAYLLSGKLRINNIVLDIHPFDWLLTEANSSSQNEGYSKADLYISLVWFTQISQSEYKKLKTHYASLQ